MVVGVVVAEQEDGVSVDDLDLLGALGAADGGGDLPGDVAPAGAVVDRHGRGDLRQLLVEVAQPADGADDQVGLLGGDGLEVDLATGSQHDRAVQVVGDLLAEPDALLELGGGDRDHSQGDQAVHLDGAGHRHHTLWLDGHVAGAQRVASSIGARLAGDGVHRVGMGTPRWRQGDER
jgi:hypothetical protein